VSGLGSIAAILTLNLFQLFSPIWLRGRELRQVYLPVTDIRVSTDMIACHTELN